LHRPLTRGLCEPCAVGDPVRTRKRIVREPRDPVTIRGEMEPRRAP